MKRLEFDITVNQDQAELFEKTIKVKVPESDMKFDFRKQSSGGYSYNYNMIYDAEQALKVGMIISIIYLES